jgi:hypothetical protein
MNTECRIAIVTLLALFSALSAPRVLAQTVQPENLRGQGRSKSKVSPTTIDTRASDDANRIADEANSLEKSREAGLLTDWHLNGRFGHGGKDEFVRAFAPEKEAAKQSGRRRFEQRRYELVFPGGTFTLPPELAEQKGVFYANSSTYLTAGGDWYVYLESGADAVVFVDGRRVLSSRGTRSTGVLRGTIHVESGYHSVMVKFTAQAAPFRVAILPPNSGSKRKNNTPYLQASPASEDMMAEQKVTFSEFPAGS